MGWFKKLFKKVKKLGKKYLKFASGKTFYDQVEKGKKSIIKKVGGQKALQIYDQTTGAATGLITGIVDQATGGFGTGLLQSGGFLPGESGGIPGGGAAVEPELSPPGNLAPSQPWIVIGVAAAAALAVLVVAKGRK